MKIIATIPIKRKSERVPGKNFRDINGIPLYQITIEKLKNCDFDKIYVDTDSEEIKEYCLKNAIEIIDRLPHLAENSANGNDLLNYHSSIINADIYFQIFITAPTLSVQSINNCIKILKNAKNYDSILTVEEIYSWFWFDNNPVNYNPVELPRSQDAKPVIKETTGLYGIRKNALLANKCRIGNKPYFFKVDPSETLDLDNEEDFRTLSLLTKSKKSR